MRVEKERVVRSASRGVRVEKECRYRMSVSRERESRDGVC